ncbi:hypothetical protein [Georgenia sp. SYP-B2076]|uniref:hypothetical protein n=1 Tax=Georgenia sp. SYP-B2076 TaxID=2495881 RepID=UPI000F8E499E|nr:hypothetical protein [Georgenia sp. SYP-B2076]
MRPRLVLGLVGLGLLAVTATAAMVAGRAPSLLDRLRSLPEDFTTAFREREAELRAALLPGEDAVAAAREDVARARAARHRGTAPGETDDATDELPYSFY